MIEADNPTLLNVTYYKPRKDPNTGKRINERFEVIYQTPDGNVYKVDEPAEADIYIVKPEFRNYNYNKPEERIEVLDKVRVPVSKIKFKIADEMGEQGRLFVQECLQKRDFKALDKLYKWPYAYACDFQPEYYYMKNWYEKYPLNTPNLSKGFMDIEIDMIDNMVDLSNLKLTSYAPVNAATIIIGEKNPQCYTFILKPYRPNHSGRSDDEYKARFKLYEEQLKSYNEIINNKEKFYNELYNEFDKTYGYIDYHLRNYDDEINMIADMFALINDRKPNYMLMWNMRFDIQYLLYRIIMLGYDPASIMCHPDFDIKICYFQEDNSTFRLEKQFDFMHCSSYTQYIDQMRLYSSIRKSQHKLKSVSLNSISDIELKDKKVDYANEGGNIITFPYRNYRKFLVYNIKDVLLQLGIERKCNDVMTYYMRSHVNMTPYNKIFKETHLLRNVRETYFEKEGWVQGNNINIINDKDDNIFYDQKEKDVSYEGAINADPVWNDNIGLEILGKKSNNLFKNCIDFDMASFYPSNKISSNMDAITLLYKGSFDNSEFLSGEMTNRSLNDQYEKKDKNGNTKDVDFTGEALNTVLGNNLLTAGYNYLSLPSITDMEKEIKRIIDKM